MMSSFQDYYAQQLANAEYYTSIFNPISYTVSYDSATTFEPEVRKALPIIEEFEWLRSRVSEILWKSDKPSSQVQNALNGAVYCT